MKTAKKNFSIKYPKLKFFNKIFHTFVAQMCWNGDADTDIFQNNIVIIVNACRHFEVFIGQHGFVT